MTNPVRIVPTWTVMVGERSVAVFDKKEDAEAWAKEYFGMNQRLVLRTKLKKRRKK